MKILMMVIALCFFRIAIAQDVLTLEISTYDGVGTKMRRETVFKTVDGKKVQVAEKIFVDATNELREMSLTPSGGEKTSYNATNMPADQKTILDGLFANAKAPVTEVTQPVVQPSPVAVVKPKVVIAQTGGFKTETCKWVSDMPRRMIFGPGCNSGLNSMLCTGFVVCEASAGGKFIRQSTCGSANCGEGSAVACTKQANFGSCKPESETKTGISDRTTEALTIED